MPIARHLLAASAIICLAAPVFAQSTETTTESTAAEAEAPADAATGATVVATVNGDEVTLGDIVSMRSELPAQYQSIPDGQLYDGLREQWVSQVLLAQAADRAGYLDRADVQRGLEMQRISYLAELYIRERIGEQINNEVVELEYKKRYLDTPAEMEVKAAHILLETEDAAKEIAEKARAEGADFAELAKEHSIGPSAPRGGDLGWFGKGQMVPEFETAAFGLAPGAVSDPIKTQFGWHVIKLDETREKARPALETVVQEMVGEMSRDITDAIVQALRDSGDVTIVDGQPGLLRLRDDAVISE